jgi:periplasmic protein CpxP/Spy
MNRKAIAVFAGLLLGSLMAGTSVAQAQVTNVQQPVVNSTTLTNRPMMRDRTDAMAQRLGLTDEQKQKVRPIMEEEMKKLNDMRTQTDLKPEERRAKYMALREETNAKLKPILTPEQWDKHTKPFARMTAPGQAGTNVVRPTPAPATPSK